MAKNTRLPKQLEPGAATPVRSDTDVNGKRGILNKSARVFSSAGIHVLNFKIAIGLEQQAMSRQRNLVLAEADPQAVFRNDCAKCHVEPTKGKTGKALFTAACGICHEAEHRASMAPDLKGRSLAPEQWRAVATHGKPGSLMPAFHQDKGGPLTEQQIDSLVEYLVNRPGPRPQSASVSSPQQ